jgi:hypothetical protein
MERKEDRCFFQLFVVLFLLTISNHYTDSYIIVDKLKVFNNVWYQYYSTSSIIDQIIVQKSIQCAGQCAQNPTCQTATFNKMNQLCLLLTEIGIGQLLPNDDAVTFEQRSKFLWRLLFE